MLARAVLAAGLALSALPVAAQAQRLDGSTYDAALATARAYADDHTLINYCLRGLGAKGPNLYIWVHDDLEDALQRLKAAGGEPAQREGLARAVMANVRFFAPEANDAALEAQCTARDVENSLALLKGVAVPLFMRPPFDKFPH